MATRTARLTTGSITGHLIGQTTPALFAVGAMTLVGIVDAYFIGRLGSAELAAMSFIFPVTNALSSLGVGVMAAIASVVSRRLGAGEFDRAQRQSTLGIVVAGGLGLALGLALVLLNRPLFRLMQAPEHILPLIDQFMVPWSLGFPLVLLMMGLNGSLRAQGEAKRSSAIMIVMAVTNAVLNPLLIDGLGILPGFGVAGSAYATIIAWFLVVVLGFRLLQKTDLPFAPATLREAHIAQGVRDLASVAAPASFANAVNPIGLSVLTALLAHQGAAAVAGFGAAGRLQAFALMPLLALSGSIGAIVGQNWGAKAYDRAWSAWTQAMLFCLAYGLVTALVLFFARDWLAGLFTDDPQVIASFTRYIEIAAWGYAGFGVLITTNGSFNAVGKASRALGLSVSRVLLVMLPVALMCQPLWGEAGVYSAELAANLGGGLLAALLAWMLFRAGGPALRAPA